MSKSFLELKNMLEKRKYPSSIIEAAIAKSRAIPRETALRKVVRQDTQSRPVFVALYDPRMPNIPNITRKHWKSMITQDKYLEDVFPKPPLVAFKRQQNIKDKIIKAKVPPVQGKYPRRTKNGMKKCLKSTCRACPYIDEKTKIKAKKFTWKITKEVNCRSKNIVYMIECGKCFQRYIGETERMFKDRIYEHLGYVRNCDMDKITGEHFNKNGHKISDMKFSILEKVKKNDVHYRKERESQLINKFNTYNAGMNKMP